MALLEPPRQPRANTLGTVDQLVPWVRCPISGTHIRLHGVLNGPACTTGSPFSRPPPTLMPARAAKGPAETSAKWAPAEAATQPIAGSARKPARAAGNSPRKRRLLSTKVLPVVAMSIWAAAEVASAPALMRTPFSVSNRASTLAFPTIAMTLSFGRNCKRFPVPTATCPPAPVLAATYPPWSGNSHCPSHMNSTNLRANV
mmetsp:Transcript_93273/g.250257  ORF Transcript_93273/g.250257 Transcript_93273/m.250257 type:complete len:201 (-) Transcript_93273:441-1043(-)